MKLLVIYSALFVFHSLFAFDKNSPFGMNNTVIKDLDFTLQKSEIYRKKYKASMDSTVSLGFGWWRVQTSQGILRDGKGVFRWVDVESEQDSFDFSRTDSIVKWAGERGLHLLPVIGFTAPWAHNSALSNSEKQYWHLYPPDSSCWDDYQEYVRKLVERYDGDGVDDFEGLINPIKHWECMNEPFNQYFLGTPEDYAKMFLKTREATKEADSNAKILGPCLSCEPHGDKLRWEYYDTVTNSQTYTIYNHWVEVESLLIYELIGLDYIDIISHHIYNSAPNFMKWIKNLREVVGSDKPIWITESGYRNSDPLRVDCRWCKSCHAIYNADYGEPFFSSVSAKWDWDKPCYTFIDTLLNPGDMLILRNRKDWHNPDTIIYNGGPLIYKDTLTVLTLGDTLEIFDRLNGNIIHTRESQALGYSELFDSLLNNKEFLENMKIFFFCMDLSVHDRYYPPRIRFGGDKPSKYLRQRMRSIYTLIDTTNIPFPAYYTIKNKISIY